MRKKDELKEWGRQRGRKRERERERERENERTGDTLAHSGGRKKEGACALLFRRIA